MRNHGVGWEKQGHHVDVWLVTAPKPGQDWDMDSDIGHESAHAAFAPVPVFAQQFASDEVPSSLVDARTPDELEARQIARMLYLYSEIAVASLRGEARSTFTRLPIEDPEELANFLRLSDNIFPDLGFDCALQTCARNRGSFDPHRSDAVFALTTPILRLLPEMDKLTYSLTPPDINTLRCIAKLVTGAATELSCQYNRRVSPTSLEIADLHSCGVVETGFSLSGRVKLSYAREAIFHYPHDRGWKRNLLKTRPTYSWLFVGS